jgi:hypothetical protein
MRTVMTLACATLVGTLQAQPTLTGAQMGGVGTTVTTQAADTTGVTPGPGGAGVTWDFSGLVDDGSSATSTVLSPGSTPYAANFPTANYASQGVSGNYGYFLVNQTTVEMHGMQGPATYLIYSNPERLMKFPFSFSDVSADVFFATGLTSDTYDRFGTNTLAADGYGTLILPTGTYNNVLRVHLVQTYRDSFNSNPITIDYINNE